MYATGYQNWLDYLAGGRKKYDRPLYDRGLYIRKASKWAVGGDLEIYGKWDPSHPFIIIHPDDTMTIQCETQTTSWGSTWNPIYGYSVRYTFYRYADMYIKIKKRVAHITERDARITLPKIQGCRQCKQTGKADQHCWPSTCYAGYSNEVGGCPDHPNATGRWHYLTCEHGFNDPHTIPQALVCSYCNGHKKRDYGSKPITIPWDGSPLRVKDGNVFKGEITELERRTMAYVRPTVQIESIS